MPTAAWWLFGSISLILIVSAESGCSKHVPASSETLAELSHLGKVLVAQYDPPKFVIGRGEAKTRSAALQSFGAIGGAIGSGMEISDAKEAGAKFISLSQLEDPIALVESRFLEAWKHEIGIKEVAPTVTTDDDSLKALSKKFRSGYLIDFRTTGWSIQPMPPEGFSVLVTSYRTTYGARVRLIHLEDKTISWEGNCYYSSNSSLTPALKPEETYGADGGIAVKAAMKTLAEACGDLLWRKFFGREAGPNLAEAK